MLISNDAQILLKQESCGKPISHGPLGSPFVIYEPNSDHVTSWKPMFLDIQLRLVLFWVKECIQNVHFFFLDKANHLCMVENNCAAPSPLMSYFILPFSTILQMLMML